ncbi:2-hydroxychromene-2-carboxylate isomerase [Saccharothrix ecbatanensis]|uniref:2-hydroxychromene-2-carboxylate isomerase n=1 Tax=Saccharothrix ecbatanensis TaxID=1105145 RepID=A0A7W9HEN7_9PSEU|nr:DsbA family protein [Saccharothrix ecbatanensis]MBB5800887.1 2-hydroxychromene-2-carboxylate isomerase [Saccharothrix ecbatanensis]
MSKAPKRPRWYFSLRSPYSWFAYRDLVEKYPDVADAIEWIPFFEPDEQSTGMLGEAGVDLAVVAMARAKNFYILQDTARMAAARGWKMTWPVDRNPVWEVAHFGWFVAEDAGVGRQYCDRVYQARWEQNLDVSDRSVIHGIAADLGIDADKAANAADDPEMRQRGLDTLVRCAKDGMFGVPFFINGRNKFFGVDRLRAFVADVRGDVYSEVEQAWDAEYLDFPEFSVPGADHGHAGGCG